MTAGQRKAAEKNQRVEAPGTLCCCALGRRPTLRGPATSGGGSPLTQSLPDFQSCANTLPNCMAHTRALLPPVCDLQLLMQPRIDILRLSNAFHNMMYHPLQCLRCNDACSHFLRCMPPNMSRDYKTLYTTAIVPERGLFQPRGGAGLL